MGDGITNGIIPSGGGAAFRGALVKLSADENVTVSSTTAVPWDAAEYDTDDIWSSGAKTRLTVPTGASKVRLSCCINWLVTTAPAKRYIALIDKNGSAVVGGASIQNDSTAFTTQGMSTATAVLAVTPGDYFEVRVHHNDGATEDVEARLETWFAMEIIA